MGYSRQDIVDKCQLAFEKVDTFYKNPFINYGGKTSDTGVFYTEVVAEFLCDHLDAFVNGIPQITRNASYQTEGHNGIFHADTPREEERIAMEMFNQSKSGMRYDYIGDMIDYQTPLKNKRTDESGKIDLLAYDGSTLYILELKKPDSDESMLRCVLEGYTYLRTANLQKLLSDFGLPADTVVKACPFVFRNREQHKEMMQERPNLKRLMELLDSKPYYITQIDGKYVVTED